MRERNQFIINGHSNMRRVLEQYVCELKIWHGNAYNERSEKQLSDYLNYSHLDKGYMLSSNINQKKKIGVREIEVGDKLLIEAVVNLPRKIVSAKECII